MKKIRISNFKKNLLYYGSLVIGLFAAFIGSSFLHNDSNSNIIYLVDRNCETSKDGWFSYCLLENEINDRITSDSNNLNNLFYNSRNVSIIKEQNACSFCGDNYDFTNFSFLYSDSMFTTNHLKFEICNIDAFTSNRKKEKTASIILPHSLALKYCEMEGIEIQEIVGHDISLCFDYLPENLADFKFNIVGVWSNKEDGYYYSLNKFYLDTIPNAIFIDDVFPIGINKGNTKAFFVFSNKVDKNIEFLHYIDNCYNGGISLQVPDITINNFRIGNYNSLAEFMSSQTRPNLILGILLISCSAIFFVVNLLLFINKKTCKHDGFLVLGIYFISLVFAAIFLKNIQLLFSPICLLICSLLVIFISIVFFLRCGQKNTGDKRLFKEKVILMISYTDTNKRSSTSIRINNFRKILINNGFRVFNIDFSDNKNIDNFQYGIKGKNKMFNFFFAFAKYKKILKQLIPLYDIKNAYIYSPLPFFASLSVISVLKRNGITVIHDVTEFKNFSEMEIKKPSWFIFANILYNKHLVVRKDKVICISKYLEHYFSERGIETVLVPPIFYFEGKTQKPSNKTPVFGYLGNPGKKDNLINCLLAFKNIKNSLNVNFLIKLYGISNQKLIDFIRNDSLLSKIVEINGYVSGKEIELAYRKIDYIFFLRDSNKRFAKAGFPSKLVEASFNGVPAITNKSSDLSDYYKDGKDIFFVAENTVESFENKVSDILLKKINIKSCNVFRTAYSNFDIRLYEDRVISLFSYKDNCDKTVLYEVKV